MADLKFIELFLLYKFVKKGKLNRNICTYLKPVWVLKY